MVFFDNCFSYISLISLIVFLIISLILIKGALNLEEKDDENNKESRSYLKDVLIAILVIIFIYWMGANDMKLYIDRCGLSKSSLL